MIRWTEGLKTDLWDMHIEHPGWSTRKLSEEMGLPWKSVDTALYRLKCNRQEHWLEHARLGFWDIESTALQSNVGWMLSWGMLLTDGTVLSDSITRREILSSAIEPDRRVVQSCIRAMRQVDCVVTFNGDRFDVPFVRSRALVHGINFPAYGEVMHIDLYHHARRLLRTTNKRLGTISEALGLSPKDSYQVSVWNQARRGDVEALKHIYDHCVADLHITQDLFMTLAPYSRWNRRSI